jgi:predicted 3-demethylubiquinone-9 3-methyltransferase (glyoxalase superfamily)
MEKKITPCLWFDGEAKEAAKLYCSIFGTAKIVSQSAFVTEINVSGQGITLLDGGPMYHPNPSISFYYICEVEAEVNKIWSAFVTEGRILVPLDKYPWGEKYGWITDKYGISWQLALGQTNNIGQKITPSFMFTGEQCGRAEEAITFYSSIFKNPKAERIVRYGANELPNEEGTVKHAQISLNDQKFMLMDSAIEHGFNFTEGVSLIIHCETQAEIDYYWEKLTKSGEESRCGWLKDKFGVSWQIIPTILGKLMSDPAKSGKAVQAFMSMRKLNIEQLVQSCI